MEQIGWVAQAPHYTYRREPPSLPYVRFSPHTARTKTPKSIPSLFFHLSNPRSNLRSPGAMKWGSFLRLSYVSAWLRPEPRRHSGGRMRVGSRRLHKLKDYDYKTSRKRLASILVGIGYRWGIYRS
ncbi:UNVERIFIED_CONTAM: hypothetical protein Sangu_3217800 [Sesamum angustifolium]|uniref:Uncharacterized protein n=1 Tax=Sesamum angustifolium TaxID=2727405 RepID=A0AAW2JJ25_9LAMI